VAIPGRVAANTNGHVVPYLVISRCHQLLSSRSGGPGRALIRRARRAHDRSAGPCNRIARLALLDMPAAFYSQPNHLGEAVNDSRARRLLYHALWLGRHYGDWGDIIVVTPTLRSVPGAGTVSGGRRGSLQGAVLDEREQVGVQSLVVAGVQAVSGTLVDGENARSMRAAGFRPVSSRGADAS
jgi:hypothetical protein